MALLSAQSARSDLVFGQLYQRHVGDVYRFALALVCDPAQAEDVTRTTFLDAYAAYGEHGGRPDSRSWLTAIAHGVCRERIREPGQEAAAEDRPLDRACAEAERAISRRLDARLARRESRLLRAHLRECAGCADFHHRQRAQRGALKSLSRVSPPGTLTASVPMLAPRLDREASLVGSIAKGDLMGIINRRNAVLGWGVWKIAKKFGRRKARAAVPGTGGHAGLNKGAIASMLTAMGGALWFWRKKSDKTTTTP